MVWGQWTKGTFHEGVDWESRINTKQNSSQSKAGNRAWEERAVTCSGQAVQWCLAVSSGSCEERVVGWEVTSVVEGWRHLLWSARQWRVLMVNSQSELTVFRIDDDTHTPGGMSQVVIMRFYWGGKAHPECGQYCTIRWYPTLNKKGRG